MTNRFAVVLPAFNEVAGIVSTLEELRPAVERLRMEVVVVDDGSTDGMAEAVSAMNWVRLIRHPYNKGYGAAIKTGVHASEASDVIALYDADGQHRPEDLERLCNEFPGHDLLVGQRGADSHRNHFRRPGKKILRWYANFLTGRKIPDLNSGLRLMKRPILAKLLHLMPDGFSFSTTSTIAFMNLGYNVGYKPIVVRKRIGRSTVKQVKHGASTLLLILRLTVLFNPFKVFLPVSALFVGLGLAYEIAYGNVMHFAQAKLLTGALFFLLTGIIIFFFGLVVDQLAEMRKHPLGD